MNRLIARLFALLLALCVGTAHAQLALTGGGYALVPAGGAPFSPNAIGISDDFDDASFNTSIWDSTTTAAGWIFVSIESSTRTEASGVLTLNPDDTTGSFEGASSVNTFDFTDGGGSGRTIYAHLVTPPTNGTATLGAWIDGGHWVRWEVHNAFGSTNISAFKNNISDDDTLMASTTWSSTDHRWLALHYTGSVWQAYTAPDNSGSPGTWTLQGASVNPNFTATALRVGVFAHTDDAETSSDVEWDGFNTSD